MGATIFQRGTDPPYTPLVVTVNRYDFKGRYSPLIPWPFWALAPLDIFSVVDCVHHREVSGDLPGIVRHAASISRTVLVRA